MDVQHMLQRQRSQSAFWTPVQQDPRSGAFWKRPHYRGSRKTRDAGGWVGGGATVEPRGLLGTENTQYDATHVKRPCSALVRPRRLHDTRREQTHGQTPGNDEGSYRLLSGGRSRRRTPGGAEGGLGAPLLRLVTDCVSSQLHWKHRVS